jgi:hypothetical protein
MSGSAIMASHGPRPGERKFGEAITGKTLIHCRITLAPNLGRIFVKVFEVRSGPSVPACQHLSKGASSCPDSVLRLCPGSIDYCSSDDALIRDSSTYGIIIYWRKAKA